MKIGSIEILPVYDGTGREVAREVLTRTGGDTDAWACHENLLDARGNLEFPLGGFLVRSQSRTVLIDVGIGGIESDRYTGGAFIDSLRSLGTAPEDVTDVLFTHLHFDHVGWATRKGEIVFPNATHRVHAADWEHFVDGPDAVPGAVRKLAPLRDRLEPFEGDVTLLPGLDARHSPGHTPGSSIYVASSGGERALFLGDVVHSAAQISDPDLRWIHDVDPDAAESVRRSVLESAADTSQVIAAPHLPGMRFGRVITVAETRHWTIV
ncbi:MBL fold metallo-hydrolase [Actinomadura sp. LD22]|uniref:MBL fold metallo-hydrolase n=1 Tax=Actinomadura physcomitrii TaxID=2650748 RepID=A0A6I4MHC5_9ACTN|nr:MBL fold metallo-hydrolase [Actinomadura physcomitrii]MWA01616.1 MBL fold metallo-hydrolase [Actinomadura physcomitrii]